MRILGILGDFGYFGIFGVLGVPRGGWVLDRPRRVPRRGPRIGDGQIWGLVNCEYVSVSCVGQIGEPRK